MSSQQRIEPAIPPASGPEKAHKRPGLFGHHRAARTRSERRRALRVWMLLGVIVLLSFADLYMTLTHLRSAGMGEDNPIARFVMSYGSPMLLGAWKAACVCLACLILIIARFRRSAELACWVCCGVLTLLTVRWAHYSTEASAFTAQINSSLIDGHSANWVTMSPE